FAVWTRANFVWMLAAGAGGALLVLGRRIQLPLKHWIAIVVGGIVGGFPFLLYQLVSRGGTWEAVSMFVAREPMRELLAARLYMLAETLLSDGEHRIMWGAVNLPDWQFWLFPIAVALGCLVCLATFLVVDRRRWSAAQIAALSFLLLGVFLFSSRLQVSEHHLIAMIPLAAVVVVLAFAVVKEKLRWGWILAATMATVYAGS